MHCRYEGRISAFFDHCDAARSKNAFVSVISLPTLTTISRFEAPYHQRRRFHVRSHVLITGPPALSGFPIVYNWASARCTGFPVSVHLSSGPPALSGFPIVYNWASPPYAGFPILRCIYHRASRIVGLPNGIQLGLRAIHRLPNFTVYLSQGLPLRRASLIDTIGPPA